VIGMQMSLYDMINRQTSHRSRLQVTLYITIRVDHGRYTSTLTSDKIRGTTKAFHEKLFQEHRFPSF
jgi:hypothetical protein